MISLLERRDVAVLATSAEEFEQILEEREEFIFASTVGQK